MKQQARLHRLMATVFFLLGCVSCCYAQEKESTLSQVDLLTKIVGFLGMVGGFFLAYMQVSLANKVEKVKGEFTTAIYQMKNELTETLHKEIARMEDKNSLFGKDFELKMATKEDLKNSKEVYTGQQELIKEQLNGVKGQLDLITKMFKDK